MSLFGSYRDDRRRRSLAEDSAGGSVSPSAPGSAPTRPVAKTERYTSAARPDSHRRVSDFAPRHGWSLALAYLAGLTVVAGLLAGYAMIGDLPAQAASVAQLLDASQGASLAGWFSAVMFAWAAAGSVLVYSIRRHKVDDYRGRYRLWLWSAAAWMVMSVDAVANLHTAFAQLMTVATRWSMLDGGAVWWIGVWGLILSILAMRLTIEVRECRAASVALVAAFSLWVAALAIDCAWLRVGADAPLIAAGCRLVGQVTLLLAIGAYARHVLLDAQGLLGARPAKPKRDRTEKKAASSSAADGKTTRIDSAHQTPVKSHTQTGARPINTYTTAGASFAANRSAGASDEVDDDRYSQYADYEEEELESGGGHLSKAERKRLRKMMRRQQREEEG